MGCPKYGGALIDIQCIEDLQSVIKDGETIDYDSVEKLEFVNDTYRQDFLDFNYTKISINHYKNIELGRV